MKAFNCILGVFAILGATYCIFFPGVSFLSTGWIVTVLLGAWGVCAIFDYFSNRKKKEMSKTEPVLGVLGLICGICAAVVSILAMIKVELRAVIDITMLYMFCGWLILSGIESIVMAVKAKHASESKMWVWSLIWGIITIVGALFGCVHLLFMAQIIGLMIGALLIMYGVRLISSVFENND